MSSNGKLKNSGAPGNNQKQQQSKSVGSAADALKNLKLGTGNQGTQSNARNQAQRDHNSKNQKANQAGLPADQAQGPCPICGDHPYCCPSCGASADRDLGPTGDRLRIVARRPIRVWPEQKNAYTPGTIISAPHHTTNFSKAVKEDDAHLRKGEPPIYTKIRPMVILWVYFDKAFAAPIYTNNGKGLRAFPQEKKDEFVPIVRQGNKGRDTESVHAPLEAVIPWLAEPSNVSLTGGVNVDFEDRIRVLGHLTADSHIALCTIWQTLADKKYEAVLDYLAALKGGKKRVQQDT